MNHSRGMRARRAIMARVMGKVAAAPEASPETALALGGMVVAMKGKYVFYVTLSAL